MGKLKGLKVSMQQRKQTITLLNKSCKHPRLVRLGWKFSFLENLDMPEIPSL
ncbi:hypothetical protein HanIR_Chr11g0537061 [Helianthus annuus]|nr:hypothetical protein HanIR_Chr11g0537061 [Helianthus annuus]